MELPPWLFSYVVPCAGSCAAGTLGGLVNRILAARRATTVQAPKLQPHGWEHGVRGDLVIGFVIGLVTYLGGIPDVPISKIIVTAIVGGVSGATYFTKSREVEEALAEAKRETAKSKRFKKATETLLEVPKKEENKDGM
jgi:hypothetical protein